MRPEKGIVKPWREPHKGTFEEERSVIWEKTSKREEDLVKFSKKEIYSEYWERYEEIKREYLDINAEGARWGERKIILDKLALMIDGDDKRAFMMLDLYRLECMHFNAEKVIRKFGGGFGWTRYEWLVHWFNVLGSQGNSQLQRWIEKGRLTHENK